MVRQGSIAPSGCLESPVFHLPNFWVLESREGPDESVAQLLTELSGNGKTAWPCRASNPESELVLRNPPSEPPHWTTIQGQGTTEVGNSHLGCQGFRLL